MKFLRFGPKGQEKPGVLDVEGRIRDLSDKVPDFSGENASIEAFARAAAIDIDSLPVVEGNPRLGSCLASVPNFWCVGLNYAKHAEETNSPKPAEPILFSKASSALAAPNDDVMIPKNSVKSDWEVELGVVIGKRCDHISVEDALSAVAGYCTINDLSEREWQVERGGQWLKGKSAPGFGPIGPWMVTADEVPDPQNLPLTLVLNGETVQDSNTSDMIFSVAEIVSYMSQFFTLLPGDVISTGTPSGVGMGMKPQRWLKPGDTMVVEVQGLGAQHQKVVAYQG